MCSVLQTSPHDLDGGKSIMSDEIYWLAWNVVLTAAMVIPYAVYRTRKLGGIRQFFLRPLPGDSPFDDEWAHRA